MVGRIDVGHGHPARAHEDGTVQLIRRADGLARLERVGGHDDDETVDGAHPGHVLDGVVRGPELAIGHAAADAHELDVGPAVGGVHLDLLERPCGEEGRGAADEGDLAAVGEASADAHHVLLGDARR